MIAHKVCVGGEGQEGGREGESEEPISPWTAAAAARTAATNQVWIGGSGRRGRRRGEAAAHPYCHCCCWM